MKRFIPRLPRIDRRAIQVAAALAALLLVGSAVALASPQAAPALTAQNTTAQNTQTLRFQAAENASPTDTPAGAPTDTPVSQPTDTPAVQPTATDTPPVPTATDTPPPDPTATPVPPAPTATPAPGYHVIGVYSGAGPQDLVTLRHVTGKIRLTWTCQTVNYYTTWKFMAYVYMVGNPSEYEASGTECSAVTHYGGVFIFQPAANLKDGYGADYDVQVTDASGPYTVTVEVWY